MSDKKYICEEIKKNGKRCKNSCLFGKNKCRVHYKIPQLEFCDVCPICLEKDNLTELSCKHVIHDKCMSKMKKLECPLCRTVPTNVNQRILDEIEKRKNKKKKSRSNISSIILPPIRTTSLTVDIHNPQHLVILEVSFNKKITSTSWSKN